ncbi:MAG: type IV secretion system protein [Silvanigrellaceae bacterium]|nr:type IV secretion system protein [Silvanigrellaceae bacterium]
MNLEISAGTFINDIIKIVDNLTADFVEQGFRAISDSWVASGFLTSILTLYILYFLYQVKFYNTPISDATIHLIKVCFVFFICTNWEIFHSFIFNVFTNEPLNIMQRLLSGNHSSISDGSLNDTFARGLVQAMSILANMPFSFKGVISSLFAAGLLIIGTFLFTLLALALIILSKFYLSLYLAIAPYFLIMFLFNGTKGLSESWVKACLNNALIPVFVGAVLLLTTALAASCLGGNASFADDIPQTPDFMGVVLYFFLGLLSAFFFKIIPEKTASLTSSLATAGLGRMASYASGLGQGAASISSRVSKGANSVKSDFAKRQERLHEGIKARAEARKREQDELNARRWRSIY